MDKQTKEAIEDSISHWKRMIAWAKKQDGSVIVVLEDMIVAIHESWWGDDCALCTLYGGSCDDCIAYSTELCGAIWNRVNCSITWSKWVKNAKVMLSTLKGLLND